MLIGASGIALEIIDVIYEINMSNPTWNLIGILDDDKEKQGSIFYRDTAILGGSINLEEYINDNIYFLVSFCSVNNFLLREEYINSLKTKNPSIRFANVIHPSAYISPSASLGEGNFVAHNVIIDSKASVGFHSIILFSSVISRLVTMGDFCFLSANVNIMGNVTIGKNNFFGVKSTSTKDIKDNNLINSGALVQKPIKGNSIVSNQGSNITEYKSRKKLQRMLRRF